eukprot:1004059-Rhodomonas_salina.1
MYLPYLPLGRSTARNQITCRHHHCVLSGLHPAEWSSRTRDRSERSFVISLFHRRRDGCYGLGFTEIRTSP